MTFETKAIEQHYSVLLPMLQQNLDLTDKPEDLREVLAKQRPKKAWRTTWDQAVSLIIQYVQEHKHNFVGGRLVI